VHPHILDDLGLVPALRHLARKTTDDTVVSVTTSANSESELSALPPDVSAALYRVAREATMNAMRHSGAGAVDIHVGLAPGMVTMQVDDDGSGFDVDMAERGRSAMGLFTMRERVGLVDGTLDIISSREQGTSVRVRIPLPTTSTSPSIGGGASFEKEHDHAR